MSGPKPVFDEETEADLVILIKDLAQRGFPFGMKEVKLMAYSYTLYHGISKFSVKKATAGYEWMNSFLKRHPDLSVRNTQKKTDTTADNRACRVCHIA